jgi:DNA-binding response OmpR family regulator
LRPGTIAEVERDAATPELIVTVRGVGYRFNDHVLVP